jgi:hypothetical protein
MLYVIDNCERYQADRRLFFVEAPESFGEFFATKLQAWQTDLIAQMNGRAWFQVHQIICVAPTATFPGARKPISVDAYLAKNSFTNHQIRSQAPRLAGEVGLSPC